MVNEAEEHADDDKKLRELVEARNHAEALIHSSEKNLTEHGDKVGPDEKSAIETAIADLKSAKDGEDAEAIKTKSEALAQASMKLGEAMYKAEQEAAGNEAGADSETGNTDDAKVVDADFEEVDPDQDKKAS